MQRKALLFLTLVSAIVFFLTFITTTPGQADVDQIRQGELIIVGDRGKPVGLCPLKHTRVKAEISGFLCRVNVTQQFRNPLDNNIEAIYTFPLPQNAAVDGMTMSIGHRKIRSQIMRREEARRVYEQARAAGYTTGLLDQERPNIFTQHVANIMPGEQIEVTISYVEILKYERGSYQFVFPMVVGPRYIPGAPLRKQGSGWSADTTQVPDASRITPPVMLDPSSKISTTRDGHNISINVHIDAGVPIRTVRSTLHEIESAYTDSRSASVSLKGRDTIPNKDFILNYDVAGEEIAEAIMTHRSTDEGFVTLILQPPDRIEAEDITPKEIVFVLDTSGSMQGFPIEKAKEAMDHALEGLNPRDTFNLITFAGDTEILFPEPVPATPQNLATAKGFLSSRSGSGGTEMLEAIRTALAPSDSQEHVRIVCFMTDGYVGNDMQIISEVQKHPNARVFSFGIGNSVNRFLLDRLAEEGRGEVEYVTLKDDGSAAAKRFHERVRSPLLTDISIDWNGLAVTDIYPKRIPDLFSARPLIVCGRYERAMRGAIRLRGRQGGRSFVRNITIDLPEKESKHDSLSSYWARAAVDDLMRDEYKEIEFANPSLFVKEAISQIGLRYRLMTPFTSFVAVEDTVISGDGAPRKITVPVYLPEGVSPEVIPSSSSGIYNAGVATEDFSLWGMVQKQSWPSMIITSLLWILAAYSFAVIVKRSFSYISFSLSMRGFVPQITKLLRDNRIEEAIKLSEHHSKNPIPKVMLDVLQNLQSEPVAETGVVESPETVRIRSVGERKREIRHNLLKLSATGWTAMMLGLIGTVIGVLEVFQGLASAEGAGISAIAGGLAEACSTAAMGLFIALPTLIMHRLLLSEAKTMIIRMEGVSAKLLDSIKPKQRYEVIQSDFAMSSERANTL